MEPIYNNIGSGYARTRQTDPVIARQLYSELQGAVRIVNIGAGTGSYEPEDADLVAVEPSSRMLDQRKVGSHEAVRGFAENLPFEEASFSHAMAVLSVHHWKNKPQAFKEINRVATDKFVAITWDPESEPFWLTRDYFPEIYQEDRKLFPTMGELNEYFDEVAVRPLQIPSDCADGFLAAFWKRPAAYLSSEVRKSMSPFSLLENPASGLEKLKAHFETGVWARNNRDLLRLSTFDAGYRLVSARVRNS